MARIVPSKRAKSSVSEGATAVEVAERADSQERLEQIRKNEAAIQLLRLWRQGDEQEQRETWEYLKRTLEEDRLSDRKLFP